MAKLENNIARSKEKSGLRSGLKPEVEGHQINESELYETNDLSEKDLDIMLMGGYSIRFSQTEMILGL
ncbi:unnamed protein product, partial [Rhizopus stolonifer]